MGYIVKNYKQGKSIVLPVLTASFCFVSAYLYLIIAGENVPIWVYLVVVAMLAYGAWSTYRKVKFKVKEETIDENNV